jgi:solute carrier family 29 (equilibrative nucleoside transporter), member 1/2/3
VLLCWLFGNGCVLAWNSMLTIEDYYAFLFNVRRNLTSRLLLIQDSFWRTV